MRNFFSNFSEHWKKPIYFWFLTILLLILSNYAKSPTFQDISISLFGLGLLVLFISGIYQISQRKWLKSLVIFVLFGGSIFSFIFYILISLFIDQITPDTFALNLKIPKNIKIENPVNMDFDDNFNSKKPDSITNKLVENTEFQLYNSFQPGLYEFDFWTGKIESGTIYLKAFEITQNEQLSSKDIIQKSSIKVFNPSDSIKKFSSKDDFTIYEGDWGQPYAARFEVWFKPENGKVERKLFSKNYKIEGWMR
jgi:energy-coupling factor transporter transmembrane protein EcfT